MEPKIRLKGFSGEWVKHNYSDVFTLVSDSMHNVQKTEYCERGCYPIVDQSKEYIVGYTDKVTPIDGTSGLIIFGDHTRELKYVDFPFCTGADGTRILKCEDIFNPLYIYYLCNSLNIPNTGYNRHFKYVKDAVYTTPETKDEQQAIASYFQHLDSLIQSTTKKIESLKQVKAASLQSMFPQEGETTPRVRFKGLKGEWEKKTLGECLTINNERNQSNVYGINDVLSVSDEVGVVNQIKLLGRSYAGKSVANYRVLKTNQIVYTKSPLKSKPYGIVKVNKGAVGIVSVLYAVYDANENVYPDYIHYYFEPTHRINNYLLPLINKGAKNTMNISDEMALTGKIWIPSFKEQKKIADYLQALDSQITLQTQRLEKLKQIKSACLDNMFV